MRKKNKLLLILTIIISGVLISISLVNVNNKVKDEEYISSLIDNEKQEIARLLNMQQYENISQIIRIGYIDLALTEQNNIYVSNLRVDDVADTSFKLLIDGNLALSEEVVEIKRNPDDDSSFLMKTVDNIYYFELAESNYEIKYLSGQWKSIDYPFEKNSSKFYYNYKNISNSDLDVKYFNSIAFYKTKDTEYDFLTYFNINGLLKVYETSLYEETIFSEVTKDMLMDKMIQNVKIISSSGSNYDRITILTDDGYIYSQGIYGSIDNLDEYDFVNVAYVGDVNKFDLLNIASIQGNITNVSSNTYYDIISTPDSTYLYGLLPSNINSTTYENHINSIQPQLVELNNEGEKVVTKKIECQSEKLCFIQTIDNKIMYIGGKKYSDETIVNKDNLNDIDFSNENCTENEIDFKRTFSSNSHYITSKNNEFYYYIYYNNVGSKMRKIPNPTYYLTYDDYLVQRKQEYIDNIDQSIIDEHYESIKDTLPKGNIEN